MSFLRILRPRAARQSLRGIGEIEHQEAIPDACDEAEPTIHIRGRLGISDPYNQLGLMVDKSGRVVPPQNTVAYGERTNRFSWRLATTPWTATAKATYRVSIQFYKKLLAGGHKSDPELIEMRGTAIHVGEGLFLTNLHVVKWPAQCDYTSHVARIWMFSGTGNLDERLPVEPSLFTKGSLEAKVVGWPGPVLADALHKNHRIMGGLMAHRYEIPHIHDFCLLEPIEKRWKTTLRHEFRPHVLPGRLDALPHSFPATLVAINGAVDDLDKYDPNANTVKELNDALASLLPGVITYSTTQAIQSLHGRIPAPPGTTATIIRYPLSATGGSSGSGLYDTATKRIVGLHSRSELDLVCVIPRAKNSSTTSPDNLAVAIAFTAPEFQEFVRVTLIPHHLMRIGTGPAKKIAAEWALIG
jgi:hypothetical protein